MKKAGKKYVATVFGVMVLAGVLAGCSRTSPSGTTQNGGEKIVKKVVIEQAYYPLCFVNEDGTFAGHSVEVFKELEKLLPQYQFVLEPSGHEAALIGLETGQYDVFAGGLYYTAAREEKFLYPKYFTSGGLVGVMVKKELGDKIKNIGDAVDAKLRFAPVMASTGIAGIVKAYDEEHPNKKANVPLADNSDDATNLAWILDGRYDVSVGNKHGFEEVIELGNKKYADLITFNSFTVVKAFDLFNKSQVQFQQDYDGAIKKLLDDGTLGKLSVKWFGEDLFALLPQN